MSLVDPSVRRYGSVEIGGGALIEANVVLGHPSARAILDALPSAGGDETLEVLYERLATATTHIGEGAVIRSGTVIYAGAHIGSRFDCGHNVVIREDVRIGDGVYLKNNTEVMRSARIGSGSRISGVVADEVVLGERVSSFGTLTHPYRRYLEPVRSKGNAQLPVRDLESPVIEDDVIIGRGAVVVGRIRVGAGAVIGANAVVTRDVAPGARLYGPAAATRRSP